MTIKILVDADAMPVKKEIVNVAKEFHLPVIMFADTSHLIDDGYSKVITVDKGRDSVDMKLVQYVKANDIVITQDYGVATMVLAKQAFAMHPNGFLFQADNLDQLLFERYLSQKSRRAGIKTSGPKKRSKGANHLFEFEFRKLVQRVYFMIK
ncbi:YaiI/YqxD family protein [Tepidibacillus infernus]|uniref:YaiI/YqxD family protein n=1 Tax=Tepidibacillus TaxID=1494427 RepID=UPI0019111F4D|nr:YaiI/YqxD family protein [Tepidibacillus decaturensis]